MPLFQPFQPFNSQDNLSKSKEKYNNFILPKNKDTPTALSGNEIKEKIKSYCLDNYRSELTLYKIGFAILIICLLFGIICYSMVEDINKKMSSTIIIIASIYFAIKLTPKYTSCNWIVKQLENGKFIVKKLTVLGLKTKHTPNELFSSSGKYAVITDDGLFFKKKKSQLDEYIPGQSAYFVIGLSKDSRKIIIDAFVNHEEFWFLIKENT